MAIRNIIIRPPGVGDYVDELHPKTSANVVISTDGNVQTDINTLKSGKANTSHTHTKSQITDFPTLGTVASKNTGTTSGTIPILDASGKLPDSVIPKIAITDTSVVATQAAMLALVAEVGDVAIRTDLEATFILTASPASTLANWKQIATPTDKVSSVNSKTGAVTLSHTDVGASPTTHNHTKSQITDFPTLSTVATSGSYVDLSNKPTIPTNTNQLTKTDVYTKTEVDNKLGSAGYGDMLKSVYDTNNDGKVDKAVVADSVAWTGISGKPTTFTPTTHTHTASQITDFPNTLTIGKIKPTDGSMWYEETI